MSLQVLNPLPSPRCSPLISPSCSHTQASEQQKQQQQEEQNSMQSKFEFPDSPQESGASGEPQQAASTSLEAPTRSNPPQGRPETTYFPVNMAISKSDVLSRKVRFRPPPLPPVITKTSEDKPSSGDQNTSQDPLASKTEANKGESKTVS